MKKDLHIDSKLFTYLSIVYMELILRLFTCNEFITAGLIFMPIFSLVLFLLITAFSGMFRSKKAKKTILVVFFAVLFLVFATQVTYHMFFNKYLIFYSLTVGGTAQIIADGLFESTVKAILDSLPAIALLCLPLVFVCIFSYKTIIYKSPRKKGWFKFLVFALLVHFPLTFAISFIPYFSNIQSGNFDTNLSVKEFGLLRTEVLDAKYNLFGIKQKVTLEKEEGISQEVFNPEDKEKYNVLNLDFSSKDNKFKALNNYFASSIPSKKNQYTGIYKGYNLVLITAEGFSPYAVDKNLTPTLYKMSTEGFKFNNFYTPIWGVSTSDGEYTVCSGLIPKAGIWSFYRSGRNYMPFGLGNMFNGIGVDKTFAYHNNTYNYYHRDISHPNLGYTYKGYGNGLEKYITKQWPQSDLEMIEGSIKDYLSDDKPFHAYYMTVSGHLDYNQENDMAAKNWDMVKDLECSETLKAYYACNIELDKALEKLINELKAAGVYEKTVIAITPDHYPYGLEQDSANKYTLWEELLGHPVEETFELYKSNFILFCGGTENAPVIDKYCSSLDILPTLLNLFGFEYDSRLLMGRDILSDSEPLVILSDHSFITSKGKYNATTKEFYSFSSDTFKSEDEVALYVENLKNIVNNKFTVSAEILEEDYYNYILK